MKSGSDAPPRPPTLSHEAHQLLFEQAPGLFLVLEPGTPFRIVAVSDAYLRATMTRREDILGKGLFEVFPDNPADANATGERNLRESLERVARHKKPDAMAVQKYDIRKPIEEGGAFEERFWSPVNSPVFDEGGRITLIIHRVEDVTEFVRVKQHSEDQSRLAGELRARLEAGDAEIFARAQEVAEANRKLREAVAKLEDTNKSLALANEGLESFTYVVSHDIKEPVRAIQSYHEQIEEIAVLPEVRELVQRSHASTLRLAKMIEGLLAVSHASRIEPAEVRPIRVADVLRSDDCSARYATLYAERRVSLDVVEERPGIAVMATPEHLSAILGNLLLNAAKHNPSPTPHVRVDIRELPTRPRRVLVSVEDDGPGFDVATVKHLSQNVAKPTTLRGGFGLIIVRRAIERLGGTMAIEKSRTLGGAAVRVALPPASSA